MGRDIHAQFAGRIRALHTPITCAGYDAFVGSCRRMKWSGWMSLSTSRLVFAVLLIVACPASLLGAPTADVLSRQISISDKPLRSMADRKGVVTRVIDGDTFRAVVDGKEITFRLLGVDAPESVHPTKPPGFFGVEAASGLRSLLDKQPIALAHSTDGVSVDKYGRSLCYAFLDDASGACINAVVVERGWARSYREYPCTFAPYFDLLEERAKLEELGVWSAAKAVSATFRTGVASTAPLTDKDWKLIRATLLSIVVAVRDETSACVVRVKSWEGIDSEDSALRMFLHDVVALYRSVRISHEYQAAVDPEVVADCLLLDSLWFASESKPSQELLEARCPRPAGPPTQEWFRKQYETYMYLNALGAARGWAASKKHE